MRRPALTAALLFALAACGREAPPAPPEAPQPPGATQTRWKPISITT